MLVTSHTSQILHWYCICSLQCNVFTILTHAADGCSEVQQCQERWYPWALEVLQYNPLKSFNPRVSKTFHIFGSFPICKLVQVKKEITYLEKFQVITTRAKSSETKSMLETLRIQKGAYNEHELKIPAAHSRLAESNYKNIHKHMYVWMLNKGVANVLVFSTSLQKRTNYCSLPFCCRQEGQDSYYPITSKSDPTFEYGVDKSTHYQAERRQKKLYNLEVDRSALIRCR